MEGHVNNNARPGRVAGRVLILGAGGDTRAVADITAAEIEEVGKLKKRGAYAHMNCKGCLLIGTALLLGGLLALGLFTITAGHFLTAVDTFSQADAIVVLGGDGGNFFRVQQGVALFNEGCAPVVVFSGGISLKDAGLACSSAQLSLEAAQELGVPTDAAIIADDAVPNSAWPSIYGEAVNLRRLAQQHRWQSLIIVTDLFHTRRAARTFHTLLPDTAIYLSAAPDPSYDAARWWQTEEGLIAVFNEVIKLIFYWARYGIAPVG